MLDFIKRLLTGRPDAQRGTEHANAVLSSAPIASATVDGVPTRELAEFKDDLSIMLRCCEAEEAAYWARPSGDRVCAAPFYFSRAAILLRKDRDDAAEIAICERWIAIEDDYAAQGIVTKGFSAQVQKGPHSDPMRVRLEKAKARLAKRSS